MAEKTMKVKVISPERVFYEGEVTFMEFNTIEGIIGIYPMHIPTTVVIAPGILRLVNQEGEKIAALHSGFAEILGDSVTILAESVVWPEEIDYNRAQEAKIRAERKLKEGKDSGKAELALKRAVLRIQLTKK